MNVRIEQSWKQQLQEEFDKPYFDKLVTFVKDEYKRAHVLPLGHQIFHIFNSCPFEKVKVVILGQDPYPNPGQYYGVCFSVPEGVAIPGSLNNIFKEIHQDLGKPIQFLPYERTKPVLIEIWAGKSSQTQLSGNLVKSERI